MDTLTADKPVSETTGPPNKLKTDGTPVLTVTIARGSITDIKTPVVVVGAYKGVAPASALKALDDSLNQWISRVGDQGMIGAELGEAFFCTRDEQRGRRAIGDDCGYGRFWKVQLSRSSLPGHEHLLLNLCHESGTVRNRTDWVR